MARPKKAEGEKYETPKRPGWRVDDETWSLLQEAAAKEGKTLVGWALPILVRAAKRALGKSR
jgi:uncharacterized protein (DUF1778 family)